MTDSDQAADMSNTLHVEKLSSQCNDDDNVMSLSLSQAQNTCKNCTRAPGTNKPQPLQFSPFCILCRNVNEDLVSPFWVTIYSLLWTIWTSSSLLSSMSNMFTLTWHVTPKGMFCSSFLWADWKSKYCISYLVGPKCQWSDLKILLSQHTSAVLFALNCNVAIFWKSPPKLVGSNLNYSCKCDNECLTFDCYFFVIQRLSMEMMHCWKWIYLWRCKWWSRHTSEKKGALVTTFRYEVLCLTFTHKSSFCDLFLLFCVLGKTAMF